MTSFLRLVFALWIVALPAQAQERMLFDAIYSGIKAGELEIASRLNGRTYVLAGRAQSTGLVSFLRKVRYDARVRGRVSGVRFTPQLYSERADTGRRVSEAEMAYRAGVPQVKTYRPARAADPDALDPATQGGTVDPLTALFLALRDVDPDKACTAQIRTFDGKRAGRLDLRPDARDPMVCRGAFVRLGGYSEEELAEARSFPFTLVLEPNGNGEVKVKRMELKSLYGRVRLVRR